MGKREGRRLRPEINTAEPSNQAFSVLVFGAGAVGTYIGGSLALHGQRVVFLEKPEIVDDLRRRGLRLSLEDGEHSLPALVAAGSLQEALDMGPFDVAIFALKSNDTRSALEIMAPFSSQVPSILCLQNGVENEAALAGLLGADRVIPGSLTSAIGRRAAGDIVLERRRGMGLASGHSLSNVLARALNQAGLNAWLYSRPADMKWSKMLTNLLANASSAILDLTPAQVFAHPGLFRLEIRQQRETLQVMAAHDIHVVDLPGTPVRLLSWAVCSLPPWLSRPFIRRAVGSGRGGKMPSFHIDLHSGKGSSEVDYLNGAVVRFGNQKGIATPVNRLLNETLLALTRGELSMEEYSHQPEKLLSTVSTQATI
jgi:2-dehydropantoate 2-reductase